MEEKQIKEIGVFLARMQPLHNGHLALIKRIIDENEQCLILIGSSDKLNKRNPIPGNFRKELLHQSIMMDGTLSKAYNDGRIKIVLLPDLTSEEDNSHDWGFYLYSNIVRLIGQHCFTMYYSDGWEIITKWFPGFLLQNSVDLRLVARNNCQDGISATKVRRLITQDVITDDVLCKYVPEPVIENLKIIRSFIAVWN